MDDEISSKSNMLNEPTSNDSPSSNTKIPPPIHRLPNELLIKIIEKIPRVQWPALELVDPKFRDATLLAWGSVRKVDVERDFMYYDYSNKDDTIDRAFWTGDALHREIARKTESIYGKLIERSPLITSLSGVSLLSVDLSSNTTIVGYLSRFEHLETIRFVNTSFPVRTFLQTINLLGHLHLIDLVQFVESTQSRAALREISIEHCQLPDDDSSSHLFDRLRAAFDNDSSHRSLKLESFSLKSIYPSRHPLDFFDTMDSSRMTRLSFGRTPVEPSVLTILINGAPELRHLDFAFVSSCNAIAKSSMECQNGRLQSNLELLTALESLRTLTSLGFNSIWGLDDCACKRFGTAFLKMLNAIGPRLERFNFDPGFIPTDIRMSDICAIIRTGMPKLKSIKLWMDECIVDSEDLRGIADFKELEDVELNVHRSFFDDELMNDVMSTIINKSPRLKRFAAEHYYPDQRAVGELCKLSDLIDLRINGFTLTNENFVAFSRVFKLEVLCLARINDGVEAGLIELVGNCDKLRVLMVCVNVADRLLECLAQSCPKLERFRIMSADGITFDSVQILVDGCPKLRWLDLCNSRQTTESSQNDLKFDKYRKLPSFSS